MYPFWIDLSCLSFSEITAALTGLAIAVHVRRRELAQLWVNVLLLLAAAFVAVGRFAGW